MLTCLVFLVLFFFILVHYKNTVKLKFSTQWSCFCSYSCVLIFYITNHTNMFTSVHSFVSSSSGDNTHASTILFVSLVLYTFIDFKKTSYHTIYIVFIVLVYLYKVVYFYLFGGVDFNGFFTKNTPILFFLPILLGGRFFFFFYSVFW